MSSDRIHRRLSLVAEKKNASDKEDMAVYKAEWDGDIPGYSWDPDRNDVRQQDRDLLLAIQSDIALLEHVDASDGLERLDALSVQYVSPV